MADTTVLSRDLSHLKGRTILLVAGGLLQVPQVEIAHALGLNTIVTDRDPECACADLADAFVQLDTYDLSGHVKLARLLRKTGELAGVFTAGADVALTVALAAAATGLPGVDPRAAYAAKNKARTREFFDKAGLPNPRWEEVETEHQALQAALQIGYPLIVKNVDNCASRGTTIFREQGPTGLDTDFRFDDSFLSAVEKAKAASTTGTALIEEYLIGQEVTVETLVWEGRQYPCFITDRFFRPLSPYAVEYGLRSPSILDSTTRKELYALALQGAGVLGIDFGAAKADVIMTGKGPRILEMTTRLSGGFDCQYLVPVASGKEVIKAAMLLALGEPIHEELLEAKWNKHAVSFNPLPPPGRIIAIRGLEEAKSSLGVEHIFLRVGVGDIIPEYRDCAARPCWIIATGLSRAAAMENASAAAQKLKIKTEPVC